MCCANHLLFFPQSTTRAINGYCLTNYFRINSQHLGPSDIVCPLSKLEAVLSVLYKPVLAIAPMPVDVL